MSRQRQRRTKHIVMHKNPSKDESVKEKLKSLESRLNNHATILSVIIESHDKQDINVMAMVKVLKEVFVQLSQTNDIFKLLDPKQDGLSLEDRVDNAIVKSSGESWFKAVVHEALTTVKEERLAAKQAKLENADSLKEAQDMETALKEAENPDKIRGAESGIVDEINMFPEGAEVFGE